MVSQPAKIAPAVAMTAANAKAFSFIAHSRSDYARAIASVEVDLGAFNADLGVMSHPLDRPVWSALTTAQASFANSDPRAKRYPLDVSPLAAGRDHNSEAVAALAALIPAGDDISMLEPAPPAPPAGITETLRSPCVQMLAPTLTAGGKSIPVEPLGDTDADAMLALALLTRPGPFKARTHTLGRFLGVRENGALIAMAGERTRSGAFIELSAVCTHPDYRGRGLGGALIRAVCERILSEHKTPYLHSYANNEAAIGLYRSLGFEVRTQVLHCVWRRP
jgi:ribosomal protein S18 acetylase RimI-like enzyme